MKDNKKLNREQNLNGASQGTMNSDTKAGNQIINFHL